MKIYGILLATFSLVGISGGFAQGIEYDDMYFNSNDRAILNAQKASELVYNTPQKSKKLDNWTKDESTNPTDSYSARNVNPEYTSRAHTQSAQTDEEDYFINNYQFNNRNEFRNWNNNFNDWYGNPWYRSNYYGPGINSWNSPYYGYNSWNSPWYDPFWSYNGWSSSFSFHFGNSWNYGWGGYYNYWNRPYYGWDPYYGMGYGGGYWNNYRYPGTIVVINNGETSGRKVVYGKRPTRGTSMVSEGINSRSRTNVTPGTRDNNGGRISTTPSTKQEEYYNRYNRNQRSNDNNSSYDSRDNTQYNRSRSWENNINNNNNSSGRTSSPSYTSPSRSNNNSGGSSGSSGSGSNGRTRGRN